MKIGMYLTVIFLALVVDNVTANSKAPDSPKHYCGSNLANMMSVVCRGIYNTKKRSLIDLEMWGYKDLEENSIRPKIEAMSIIPSRSQRGFKIIEECCYKPCYLSELQAYCGNTL